LIPSLSVTYLNPALRSSSSAFRLLDVAVWYFSASNSEL